MNGIQFLKTADGNVFDVCAVFYTEYLKEEQDRSISLELFKHLISRDIISDQSNPIEGIVSEEEYLHRVKEKTENVNKFVNKLIDKGLTEDEFYNRLWDFVFDSVFYESDEDIISVLICLVMNQKIPYFKLDDPVEISEKEFNKLMVQYYDKIQKAEFIMSLFNSKKTITASQLLDLMEPVGDEKAKSVILANALGVLYERIAILADLIAQTSNDVTTDGQKEHTPDSEEAAE